MSQWGNRDSIQLGSVSVTQNSNAVVSADLIFDSSNVDVGDTIFLANVGYKVKRVTNSGNLVLDVNYTATTGTVDSRVQQSPKNLTTYGWGDATTGANTINARNVYGIDRNEIIVEENKDRGIGHTGWVHYKTYTSGQGQVRNKSEVLVAMSKNFNANATGTLNRMDNYDDTVAADYYIYYVVEPTNASNTNGNSLIFTAEAATLPAGGTLSYQWYESPNNLVYSAVIDGGQYSGNTTNTLTVANVAALSWEDQPNVNQYWFKLTTSGTDGADSNSFIVYASEDF